MDKKLSYCKICKWWFYDIEDHNKKRALFTHPALESISKKEVSLIDKK